MSKKNSEAAVAETPDAEPIGTEPTNGDSTEPTKQRKPRKPKATVDLNEWMHKQVVEDREASTVFADGYHAALKDLADPKVAGGDTVLEPLMQRRKLVSRTLQPFFDGIDA